MNLYELTDQFRQLESEDLDPDMISDTLNSLKLEINLKVKNVVRYIKNCEGESLKFKVEADRLAKKAKTASNRSASLKTYLEDCVKSLPDREYKDDIFKVCFQKNPPSVSIIDEKEIDLVYFNNQDPVLDKKRLLVDLKAGAKIKGVELKQTESLRIK